MQPNSLPLCVYHGGCDDGFGAALAVHMGLQGMVELFSGAYDKPPPSDETLKDRDVIFVDFSYKKPVIEHIISQCRSLLILDHHKTAEADLAFLSPVLPTWEEHVRDPNYRALFDMSRSGAMLAYNYFLPHKAVPMFFKYLQDRDLWLKELPNGDEFTIALRSYPQTIEHWGRLQHNIHTLIEEGYAIQRYYRMRVEEIKKTAVVRHFGGHDVLVANAPYFSASEVAGELAEGRPFGACYFYNGHDWQFSLRSRADYDVSELAKTFGGGGHARAAGFAIQYLPWEHH
jgi:oligoribonuclease NrnB/cAMP/cGMP phosphodiesterase (DHH superfamily)